MDKLGGNEMDYQEVIEKLERRIVDTQEELRSIGYYHTSDYQCEELQIAIEAVKFLQNIVRCKDCKYSNGTSCKVNHDEYGLWLSVLEIRYCSRGKRRDE